MVVELNQIVPWGRSRLEYERMFALSHADLHRRILGVGDGPASFNAEMHAAGHRVVSIDPIYRFSGEQIHERFRQSVDVVMDQVIASPERWVWSFHADPEALRTQRVRVIQDFLADFDAGRTQGRYVAASLPRLPFADDTFDLAVCSHLLFLYTDLLGEAFHLAAFRELVRVAREVRVFPLLTLRQEPSPLIEPVCAMMTAAGLRCRVERVEYELQRGGNQMLRIGR